MQKLRMGMLMLAAMMVSAIIALAGSETAYNAATDGSGAKIKFGPANGQTIVTAIAADSDKASAALKVYARTGKKYQPSVAPGATPTNIYVTTAGVITNGDLIAYVYSTGEVDIRTVTTSTTTNLMITAALSGTGTTADWIYELSQQGQQLVGNVAGTTYTNAGSHTIYTQAGELFATPSDSPLYMVLECTTNSATLQATVKKP